MCTNFPLIRYAFSLVGGGHLAAVHPSKNELARSCKIVQESCKNLACKTCPFSCMILAQSCTYLARNGARFCKSCCKKYYLHILCKILQELVQTYCVQVLHARFLQDSCMILQVRFCTWDTWDYNQINICWLTMPLSVGQAKYASIALGIIGLSK